jgi:ubiquinone/menaquinone biosynthesis C-methylase UbiE
MTTVSSSVKAYKGIGMRGPVAKWYASLTRKSLNEFQTLARRVADEIPPGARVLEVAPGPGYFAIELAKLGNYRITGLDISSTFVEIARTNASREKVDVEFRQGNAAAMPFENESFDFLLCRAAFKNFTEPQRALQEMYRVLKANGRALIIDLRGDATTDAIAQEVDRMGLSAVNSVLTKLTFRFMLLKRAYTKQQFEQLLSETRFEAVEMRENLVGLEIWLDKTRKPV